MESPPHAYLVRLDFHRIWTNLKGSGHSDNAVNEYAEQILSLEEYARELALLGLTGRSFTAEMYAEALGERLRLDVRIVRSSIQHVDIRELGATNYDTENGLVTVSVPLRLEYE